MTKEINSKRALISFRFTPLFIQHLKNSAIAAGLPMTRIIEDAVLSNHPLPYIRPEVVDTHTPPHTPGQHITPGKDTTKHKAHK